MAGIEKFIKSVCVQTAVYWGNPQPDGFGGATFDDPVEIPVRWEEKMQTITGTDGKEFVSSTEVLVTDDYDLGGFLMFISLVDLQDMFPKQEEQELILITEDESILITEDEFQMTSETQIVEVPGDISDIPNPLELSNTYEIKHRDRIPMIKSTTVFVRKLYLSPRQR